MYASVTSDVLALAWPESHGFGSARRTSGWLFHQARPEPKKAIGQPKAMAQAMAFGGALTEDYIQLRQPETTRHRHPA